MEKSINNLSLINAVQENNYDKVKELCETQPELIGIVDEYNNSPLLYAVNQNNYDIVALLFSYSDRLSKAEGVNISKYTSIPGIINKEVIYRGQIPGKHIEYKKLVTPLMLAVINKNIDIIYIFIHNKCINYRHLVSTKYFRNSIKMYDLVKNGVNTLFYAINEMFNDINEMFDNIKINGSSYDVEYDNKISTDLRIINILLDNNIYHGYYSDDPSDDPLQQFFIYEEFPHPGSWKNSFLNMKLYINYLITIFEYGKLSKYIPRNNKIKKKFMKLKRDEIKAEMNEIMKKMIFLMEKPKKGARFGIRSSCKLEQPLTESKTEIRSEPSHSPRHSPRHSSRHAENNKCSQCTICGGKK